MKINCVLSLHWFFIGYWNLKTGLHLNADPFFFYGCRVNQENETPLSMAIGTALGYSIKEKMQESVRLNFF